MRMISPNSTRFALFLIAGFFAASPACAQEFQPYPSPKITVEEWSRYLATVRARLETSAQIYKDKNIVVFSDQPSRTFYIFTTKKHPAYPAWITRQLVEEDGQVNVRQIGFFAGPQEPFDKFFREYLERTEQLKEEVDLRNQ